MVPSTVVTRLVVAKRAIPSLLDPEVGFPPVPVSVIAAALAPDPSDEITPEVLIKMPELKANAVAVLVEPLIPFIAILPYKELTVALTLIPLYEEGEAAPLAVKLIAEKFTPLLFVLVIAALIAMFCAELRVRLFVVAQVRAPETVMAPPVVVVQVELVLRLEMGRPDVIPLVVVMLIPRTHDPVPAVVNALGGVAPPTALVKERVPPVVIAIAPVPVAEPSIVLLKVTLLVPPLVILAVEAYSKIGLLKVIEAVDPEPVEIVQAPKPMLLLQVKLINPVPLVVTDPVVSIWIPFELPPPAPDRVNVPLTAVSVPPLT